MFKRFLSTLLLIFLLTACNGQSAPTATVEPTATRAAEATFTPLPGPTDAPSATPAENDSTATPEVTPTIPPTEQPREVGPNNMPASVNPLTGLVMADPTLLERRPVAVKVNIVPRNSTRPPWGLSFADIVYDYYHNDGYSRLHAIFYGADAELVGPVRSGRLPDAELVRMYQSIFAYGSADQTINNRFFNSDFANRLVLESNASPCPPTNTNPMCRFDPSGYQHLLAGTSQVRTYAISKGSDNLRPNLTGMTFNQAAPANGVTGTEVITRYSLDNYTKWQYDPATGRYLRFQDKEMKEVGQEVYEPLLDRLTNQQIAADNVVVLLVPHSYFVPPPGEIVEILLSGTGKAFAFRDGQRYEVVWNRPTVSSVLFLTFPDGTAYPFKPGNTWFQVVGTSSQATQPAESIWRYDFQMP
jgi:hypothetical protein